MKFPAVLLSVLFMTWLMPVATGADKGPMHNHPSAAGFGSPGKESQVTRTVEVQASDDMRFSPGRIEVKRGETIRFVVRNTGKIAHEFSIGDRNAHKAHAAMMKSMPDMHHEDSETTVMVEPGKTKTLIWKFDKQPAGPLEIACNIPGHYEAGMKAPVALRR
jgi:uncharacterized cupredoxin-like copper-binding protein